MNSEFELIRYNDNLPARIEIKQGEFNTPYHWHKEIELVYVLDGALENQCQQHSANASHGRIPADQLGGEPQPVG